MAEYAAFGAPWYWIVDPDRRSLEVYELDAEHGSYRQPTVLRDEIANVPGCAGLRIDLRALWKKLDELSS